MTDDAHRHRRAVHQRATTPPGWSGSSPTPGRPGSTASSSRPDPDLVWLTGYQPTAITERLTMLVPDHRPGADAAGADPRATGRRGGRGRAGLTLVDWADGDDPYAAASALLRPDGAYGDLRLRLGDAPARPAGGVAAVVVPLADPVPADAARGQGRQRAGPAGGGRRRRRRDVRARSSRSASPAARRPTWRPTWRDCCASSGTSRSTSPSSAPARTAPTRTTRPATGSSRSATRSCSTSAG